MKNKKHIIITLMTFFILILPFFILKYNYKTEVKNLEHTAVATDTKYYDWSATSSGPLTDGYLSNAYSYSTIYYTSKTEIKILKEVGELSYHATTGDIKLPYFNKLTKGELRFLITNCAVNADGEALDVVVKVKNIKTWSSDSYMWIKMVKYVNLLDSQLNPGSIDENGYNYREQLKVGTPISFLLHTEGEGGECEIFIKYYKTGTYDNANDTGEEGGITRTIGFFSDIDVKYSASYSDRFLAGREGFAPTTGTSYIFYNKNKKKVSDSANWNVELKALDNGITVNDLTKADVNAYWYQSSAFIATKDLTNSTYSFKYGGKGCGMWFMFASPYPYKMKAPTKKTTKSELAPGKTATYKISQYVPNNYYGNKVNYAEVYDELIDDTLFSSFRITDTIDSYLTVDKDNIKVKNDAGTDRTSWFEITVSSSNKVTATLKSDYLEKSSFYNRMYTLEIPVTLKTGINKATISNEASSITKLGSETAETLTSNSVNIDVFFNITVKHLIQGTTTSLADTSTVKAYYGDTYTTSKATVDSNYELVSTPSNATGTALKNDTVTYYYKLKTATITVHHYIEGTTTKLADSVVTTQDYTTEYTTSPATVDSNYELVSTPSNATGTVSGNITVKYYYRLKKGKITVHHYKQGTTEKLADSVVTTQDYTTEYTTSPAAVDSNYELVSTPSNATGTVSGNVTVKYYYKLKTGKITVHHYIEGTTTKLADSVVTTQDYTTKYTTSPATVNSNYELVSTPSNATGTVNGNITVKYYYKKKTATLTVHHYIEGTTTKLTDSEISTVYWGDTYSTQISSNVSNNYKYSQVQGNPSGTVNGNVTVIYYYKLKTATITVHHYIEGTTTKLADDVITTQNYTTTYTTSKATVDSNYELVSTPSNAKGTVNGNVVVTYYYKLKTATITVHHYIEGTTTKLVDDVITTQNYTTTYKTSPATVNSNYELVSTPSNASGKVSGNVTVTYYYKLKTATITVHHYIEGTTTKLADDVITTQKYTTTYTTSQAIVNSNYKLVSTPSNASGTVSGNITVIYYYKLKEATLTINHYIEGTTDKLSQTITKNVHWGDEYTTSPATDINKNYKLVSTPTNATGTISGNVTVNYYYSLKEATLTVHHYIEGTTTKLSESIVKGVNWGDSYTTNAATDINKNYELVSTPTNAKGTIEGDTIVIYYYKLKEATLTVHHYIEGTTDKLSDTTIKDVHWGDDYTTSQAKVDSNYELVSTPSNATGKVSGNVTVTYYYKLKTATITVHHYIEGTTTKLAEDVVTTQKYTTSYTTQQATVNTNYELVETPENATGKISGNVTVTYYYKLKTATLTVNHYIEGTTTPLASTTTETVYWGNEYTTNTAQVDSNYEYSKVSGTPSGTVSGNITVTYYYKKKTSVLTVHHYIDGTTTKLADDQVSTVYYGDTYTTDIHKDIPDNYELKSKTTNYTGIISTKTIEVIYYYQKKDSSLETSITKVGPEEINKKDELVEYKITYTAKVTDYIGEGTITIVDTLPHKINTELSNLAEGTYDEETNTITWTIPWNGIDSFNNKGEITIEKNISLVYSDLLPTERIMVNSVKGTITLDNNSREIESQTSTNIKVPGTIIVHYYIKDTEVPLIESIEETNLVGETYISTAEEIEGYRLTKPETEEYVFTEEPQVVIYYYEKIKVRVNTKVEGIGGTITGDEDVNYGDDSTKDKIIIKPDEGYVLGSVIINGEKLELSEKDKYGLVLENFHEMKEDMNIVVKFEKVEENPNTGSFINYIVLISVPLSLGIFKFIKNKKKLIKL